MKTQRTPQTILSLLSATLLTFSVAWAQSSPPNPQTGGEHAVAKQQRNALISNLSVEQKLQLRAATKKVHDDPKMVAARQGVKDAQTKEAKHEAKAALRSLRHDLLLKADPALAGPTFKPILDHLDAAPVGKPTTQAK
ncbi:MAG: hypothetical protein NTW91_00025 [Verrucomicrobia bacterium]|jgi:hypothetical protein|nr:hypothetical protein [Verrucomicrobiota bacterium]